MQLLQVIRFLLFNFNLKFYYSIFLADFSITTGTLIVSNHLSTLSHINAYH